MAKKFYKHPERRRKVSKKTIIILIIITTISLTFQSNKTLDSIWILDFIKNPLNVIAIVSLLKPLLIIEPNKKEIYQTIENEYKRLKEEDKINAQIEKNATL